MTTQPRLALPDRTTLVDLVAAALLVTLALYSFQSSYGGIEYLVIGVVGVVLGVVTSHLCIQFRLPVITTAAVGFVLYATVGGVVALRDQAFAGFLPSPATVVGSVTAIVTGWKQLLTTVPPVGATGDLLVLPMLMGIVAAGATVLLACRTQSRLLPALPAGIVLCLGVLCGTNQPVSVLVHGAVFAVGAVAWAALRHNRSRVHVDLGGGSARRTISSAALLVVAAVAGLTVSTAVPFVDADDRVIWRDTTEPPFDPNDFPSPLNSYRRYVKLLADDVLFTVEGLPPGVPIRMVSLDAYDGVVWRLEGGARARPGGAAYFERVGTDVEPDFGGEEIEVTVAIPDGSAYREVWVPTVGEVRSIRFEGERARELADAFRYNRPTDSAALSRLGLQPGDSYTMRVALPATLDDVVDDDTILPVTLPDIQFIGTEVSSLGSGLLETESRPVRRVRALAKYLSDIGYYSDGSEDQAPARAGHGSGRLDEFAGAEALVGNAEQYAAALGLMLRNQELPARVVVGFVVNDMNEDGPTEVTGLAAEAWVEVPIDGVGWVWTNPTPSRDRTSIDVRRAPRPIPERETQVPPPPVALEPDAETDPASESDQTERREQEDDEEEEDEVAAGGIPLIALIAVVGFSLPIVFLGVPAALVLWLKRRRRRRRRHEGRPDHRIAGGWTEMVDFVADSGRPVPATATRGEAAQFVGAAAAPVLARRADGAVFGPYEPSDADVEAYWVELEAALAAMRSELSFTDRVRAQLNIASLRSGRRRGGR